MTTSADLSRAATLLRTLAEAERARIVDDNDKVARLLDSVDPLEAYAIAATLEFEAAVHFAGLSQRSTRPSFASIRRPW